MALRLSGLELLEFARAQRRVHRYSARTRVALAPNASARLRLSGRDGRPILDFVLAADELGLRSPAPPGVRSPSLATGRRFVHALGDSFTMGWGVAFEEAWPARLEALCAPDVRVLNLGVDGFGTLAASESSRALAERYPPLQAIWLLVANDFDDDERALAVRAEGGPRQALRASLDALRRHSALAAVPFALRYLLAFRWRQAAPPSAPPQPRPLVRAVADAELPAARAPHATLEALDRHAVWLSERGAPLTVLVVYQEAFARESLELYRHAQERGYAPLLLDPSEELLLPLDGHLNAAGNARLAEFLAQRPQFDAVQSRQSSEAGVPRTE